MLGHEYTDMPGRSTEIGDNPHETVMLLRCKWCMLTPSKAREDGCPKRELETVGKIRLSAFNPDGLTRFANRLCVTCHSDIMLHWLRDNGTMNYFCTEDGSQTSDGIIDPIWDIPNGFNALEINAINRGE